MFLQLHTNKLLAITLFLFLFVASLQPVYAGGMIFTSEYTQIAPSEFRALIVHDGQKETLYDSLTFTVNPLVVGNFAWVIPVPSKPEVSLMKEDIFLKLEETTDKQFSKDTFIEKILYFDLVEENAIPSSRSFTRPINYIQNNVFGGENGLNDLKKWLDTYGYFIPKKGETLLKEYHERGWYFVTLEVNALHIQYNATDSLTIHGAHTYPVKITFDSEKIVYPLTFASVQPDLDSETVPYSFDYKRPSEDLLGEKNEAVDQVLAYQSINKFPRMPLDYIYSRTDLYVLTHKRASSDGFVTTFANTIEPIKIEEDAYDNVSFMTAMYNYKPQAQLTDVSIDVSDDQTRINPTLSTQEKVIRGLIVVAPILFIGYIVWRKIKKRRNESD